MSPHLPSFLRLKDSQKHTNKLRSSKRSALQSQADNSYSRSEYISKHEGSFASPRHALPPLPVQHANDFHNSALAHSRKSISVAPDDLSSGQALSYDTRSLPNDASHSNTNNFFVDVDKIRQQEKELQDTREDSVRLKKEIDRATILLERASGREKQLEATITNLEAKIQREHSNWQASGQELREAREASKTLSKDLDEARRKLQDSLGKNKKLLENLGNTQSALEDLQAKKHDFKRLQGELDTANSSLKAQDDDIRALTKKVDSLKLSEKDLQKQQRRDKRTKESLEGDLLTERDEVVRLRKYSEVQAKSISDLEHELLQAGSSQQKQAEDVRKAQETVFQMLDQGQWMPDADSEVTQKLDRLSREMRAWCQNFASKTITTQHNLTPDNQARIDNVLSRVCQRVDGDYLVDFADEKLANKLPAMLLYAALANELYDRIFNNPFFFETSGSSAKLTSGSYEERTAVLQKLYQDICERDRKGANLWRSQTLRLLDPHASSGSVSDENFKEARQLRVAAAQKFVSDFICGDARAFLENEKLKSTAERSDQLEKIAVRAAEVSYRLWTQKTQLSSLGLEGLSNSDEVVCFKFHSDMMEHHWIHTRQINDRETSLDGKRVVVVAHPAVVAFGDAEGKDYSKRKVWKKAIVWMEQ